MRLSQRVVAILQDTINKSFGDVNFNTKDKLLHNEIQKNHIKLNF